MYPVPQKKRSRRLVGPGPLICYPCGFFNGAAAENIGGDGFVILMDASYSINFSLGCGRCTNTRAEILALWAILMVSKQMGIPLITIFGDSLVIISWVNRLATLNVPSLSHWCDEILSLLHYVPPVTIKHIYREHNQQADGLSKQALLLDPGLWRFTESLDSVIIDHGIFKLF